jgi:hypothetical protein
MFRNSEIKGEIWFKDEMGQSFPLLHEEVRKSSKWRSNPVILQIQASKSLGSHNLLLIMCLYDT